VNAKDTLRQVKLEMGLLYKEIERQADTMKVNKTIGSGTTESAEDPGAEPSEDQQ
jgi:hypothetical protein